MLSCRRLSHQGHSPDHEMKTFVLLLLGSVLSSFGQGIGFDFQNVPPGALPGGFLTLEVNGVTAFFSAAGTTVSVSPNAGVHVLHTASFTGQIGIEFPVPVRQVTLSLDPLLPAPPHTAAIVGYYDRNFSVLSIPNPPSTSGSSLVYSRGSDFWGVLLENRGNGFALSRLVIQPVPPAVSYLVGAISTNIDRQTGLYYQQVIVTNSGVNPIQGLRISATNLPSGVRLVSATGTNANSGTPFVEFISSLSPGATLALSLAYYSFTRLAPSEVGVSVEAVIPPILTASGGETLAVRRAFIRPDGKTAVEFDSLLGRSYLFEYSDDLRQWKQAQPVVVGDGTRMIWVDTGPPGTDSPPSASRYYRVVLLPP